MFWFVSDPGRCPLDSEKKKNEPNGTCVCRRCYQDPHDCPEPSVHRKYQNGTGVPGNCCDRFRCILPNPCPPDSSLKKYGSECVCNACEEKKCSGNDVPSILLRGIGLPGNCCDTVICSPGKVPHQTDKKGHPSADPAVNTEHVPTTRTARKE
ncbi:hypothetical protein GE061_008918 [Apolygus lucorum]|uniref:Uncharacterized protein n=1 Tax=Apolygus lucorum TaxID=248454 RepID=A0A8S9Y078_APOLU|nr:hypothetical protein GE061_008918 [Apolygus lucorum]